MDHDLPFQPDGSETELPHEMMLDLQFKDLIKYTITDAFQDVIDLPHAFTLNLQLHE